MESKLQDYATKYAYAVLGTGDFLVGQAKVLAGKTGQIAERRRQDAMKLYGDLVQRGERVAKGVKQAKPAKRVAENAKQAQRQIKGAVTSVKKALSAEEKTTPTSSKKAS